MAESPDGSTAEGREPPAHWPAGVKPLSYRVFQMMGVNEVTKELYWDGKPVEVRRRLDLTWRERVFAVAVGLFTILGSIGAVAQGWTAAHQWACQTQIVAWGCPPSVSR